MAENSSIEYINELYEIPNDKEVVAHLVADQDDENIILSDEGGKY